MKISTQAIRNSDIIIVNFNEIALKSYGTIAEVGYAYGFNKIILGLGEHIPDLWFVQSMCEMFDNVDLLKAYINDNLSK